MNAFRKYASFVVCFIEATVLGSALFGWASLVFVLQEDGLYSHLCQSTTNTTLPPTTDVTPASQPNQTEAVVGLFNTRCPEQKIGLSVPYTCAIIVFGVGALPVGWFFDRFGLRSTRTIIALIGAAGYLQLALVLPGSEWMVMTGAACVGISCYVIIMTTSFVALLAEPKASVMNAINNAGIGTSFAYTAVKVAYEHGVSRMQSLIVMSALWVLVLFSSWCLLPPYKIQEKPRKEKQAITALGNKSPPNDNYNIEPAATTPRRSSLPNPGIKRVEVRKLRTSYSVSDGVKWKNQLMGPIARNDSHLGGMETSSRLQPFVLSSTFIRFLYWFCALHVRIGMMINGYDAWMTQVVNGDIAKVSYYTDVMAYAVLGGVITTPFPGIITDYVRSKLSAEPEGTATAMIPVLVLSSLLLSFLTLSMFVADESAIVPAVAIFAVAKPCLYSTTATFVGLLAPREHFGIVFGIANIISGIASFMIHPYLVWVAKAGTFAPVNGLLLATTLLSLSLPVKLFTDRRIRRQQQHLLKFTPGVSESTHM